MRYTVERIRDPLSHFAGSNPDAFNELPREAALQ
jgi:hypothetical protein